MASPITTTTQLPTTVGTQSRVGSQPETSDAEQTRQPVAVDGNRAPVTAPVQVEEPSAQELDQAAQDISNYIQTVSRSLQISVDRDLGATVITVLNADTDEVVRQIPREELLQIARFLAEQQQSASDTREAVSGLLFNDQA